MMRTLLSIFLALLLLASPMATFAKGHHGGYRPHYPHPHYPAKPRR